MKALGGILFLGSIAGLCIVFPPLILVILGFIGWSILEVYKR